MRTLAILVALLCHPALLWAQVQDDENPLDLPAEKPAPSKPAATEAPPPTEQPPTEAAPAEEAVPAEQTAAGAPPMVVLGLGGGVFIPTSEMGVSFLVGLDAAYQLPWFGGKLGVGAGFAYSQPTITGTLEDDRVPGGSFDYNTTMHEAVLDFLVTFRLMSWDSVWSPHAGVGPVVYFLSHSVEALGVEQTETSTEAGFLVVLGADYRIWHGAIIGEVRIPFGLVGQRTTGDSNVGAVSVVLGYRFRI
jgi:hypothetical protein